MEVRQLLYFIEVAERRSFTSAAAALYTTQPALTKAVKQLEEELGVRLIERSNKFVQLTDTGEVFYQYAKEICNQMDDLHRVVKDTERQVRGRVVIGAPVVSTEFFADLIQDFARDQPGISVQVELMSSREAVRAVLGQDCDIGIVMLPVAADHRLSVRVISSSVFSALVHRENPLAGRVIITVDDLRDQPLILYNDDYPPHQNILDMCTRRGFLPRVADSNPRVQFLVRMTVNRKGLTILPDPYIQEYGVEELISRPFQPEIPWEIAVIYKKDRYLSRAVKLVLDYTWEYFPDTSRAFIRTKRGAC